MGLLSWRQWFNRKVRASRRPTPARNNNVRLQVEALEVRLAPASDMWTGAAAILPIGGSNNWSNAANWSNGTPVAGEDLIFGSQTAGSKALTSTNDLAAGTRYNSITVNGSGYTIQGASITLGPSGIIVGQSDTGDTISFNISLGTSPETVGFNVAQGSDLTLSGQLSAAFNSEMNKQGTGALILSHDNSTYNGSVTVNQGILQINNNNALGNPTGNSGGAFTTTVDTGATLETDNTGDITKPIRENLLVSGAGMTGTGALYNLAGTSTWAGTVTMDNPTVLGAAASTSLNVTGVISDLSTGFSLTKEGAGQVILSAANTYQGVTFVNNGTLTIRNAQALGTEDGTTNTETVVSSTKTESGTLQLEDPTGVGFAVQNELLVLNGAGYNPGTGGIGALDNLNGSNTWNGNITLGSPDPNGSNVSIASEDQTVNTVLTPTNLTITGVISDVNPLLAKNSPYSLTKIGAGRITLEPLPSGGNTYLGTTTVQTGYLRIEDSQALGPNGTKTTFGKGTFVNFGAALEMYADPNHVDSVTGAAKMITTGAVTTPKGELQVNQYLVLLGLGINDQGALHSIQGINTWSGTIVLASAGSSIGVDADPNESPTNAYLTNDYSLTVTGIFVDGKLTKLDAGQLIVPIDNPTWFGNTDIQQGWITVEKSDSLGGVNPTKGDTTQSTIQVENGAALHLLAPNNGSLALTQNLILSGQGITHPFTQINQLGAIENLDGINTLSGLIQLQNGAGIGVENVDANPSKLTTTGQISTYTPPTTFTQSTFNTSGEQDFFYDTGATSGSLTITYNMISPATGDDLKVYYGGKLIGDTGTVTGFTGSPLTLNYSPITSGSPPTTVSSTVIEIVMNQGGALPNQNWTFTVTFSPSKTAATPLRKLGSQELDLQGPGTYTAPVDVVAGVVRAQNSTALGAPGSGGVTVESGAALEIDNTIPTDNGGITSGIEVWNKSLTLNGTGNTTVTNPTSFSTIAPLTVLAGDSTWRGPVSLETNSTIDVESAARFAITGVIDDVSNTVTKSSDLTKIGTGELVLDGANTYNGTTYVTQGVVTLGNSQALGGVTNGTIVANGASLQLEGGITVAGEALTVQGAGAVTSTNVTPDWFNLGPAPIDNGQTLGTNPGNVSGRITGVTADPNDPNTIYISAAGGGGWKTIDGGQTWQPMFDQANQANPSSVTPLFTGAIAIAPSNANIIYLGTGESDNSGDSFYGTGVYKSTDSGRTWNLLTSVTGTANPLYGQAISKIVVDPFNPNLIYAASSDLAFNSPASGVSAPGVYRYDGTNWFDLTGQISAARTGMAAPSPGPDDDFRITFPQSGTSWSDLALVNGILFAALGDPQVFTDAKGNPIGDPNNAVFRDPNPASNTPVWYIGDGAKPDSESSKEFPAGANTAGRNNGVIKITAVSIPVPPKAGVPQPPTTTIYASVEDAVTGGLLDIQKSTDGGVTWAAVKTEPADFLSPQGSYDNSIVAKNDGIGNTVYVAGVENYGTGNSLVFVTTDGGGTWTDISSDASGNGPHTDMHSLWLDNQGRLLTGNDGGIWRYDPSGKGTWTDLNGNLAITTFNGISADPTNPNRVFGGSQDNGTEEFTGSQGWTFVDGGDGGLVHIDPVSTNIVYHVLNGTLQRSTQGGALGTFSTVFQEGGFGTLYFSNVVDNVNSSRLILGAHDVFTQYTDATTKKTVNGGAGVYQSLDQGSTWSFLGPGAGFNFNLITSVAVATYQGIYQTDPAFPKSDVPNLGSNTYDPNTIYAISNEVLLGGYHVELTKDLGQTWVDRTSNLPSGLTYESITVDPRNRDTAYLVTSDGTGTTDGSGNLGGRVYVTNDAGQTWTNVTGDLPDIPTWTLVIDPRTGNLYVGNDNGVYETGNPINSDGSINANPTWARFGVGLPDVQVKVIDLNQTLNTLTVGTYGRSAYQLTLDDTPTAANPGAFRSIAGTNVWTGTVTLAANTTISAEGTAAIPNGLSNASLEILGTIQDGGQNYNVIKTGLGTVIYSGANTYGGTTTVQQGVLVINNAQALPTNAGTYVDVGAALDLEASTSAALFLDGDGIFFNDHNTGALRSISGTNTASGPITLESNTTIGVDSGSTLDITGLIGDGGSNFSLTKELTGTLALSAANTYTNATFVNQGILLATNANSLGANGNTTEVIDGAQLQLEDLSGSGLVFDATDKLILGGTGITNTGALQNIAGNNTWAGSITLTSRANTSIFPPTTPTDRVTVNVVKATDTLTFSGPIGETTNNGIKDFGIDKAGPGKLVLSDANSFTGNTNVLSGVLNIQNSTALGTGTTSTTTVSAGAALELQSNTGINVHQGLALNGAGLSGAADGVLRNVSGVNTWSGNVALQSASTIATLASTSLNVSGVISDNNKGYTLTKIDNGTLILSGANTYLGQTLVTAGIVNVQNNQGLGGVGNAGTVVSNGATLQLQGGVKVSNAPLTLSGQGFGGIGALDNPSGNNTFDNTITLTGNTTFSAEAGSVLTVDKAISDGGNGYGITKIGAGTVDLSATNTYTGTTTVNAGLLLVDGVLAAGASLNGGTLGGIGRINGNVSATATGGTLAPGDGTPTATSILTVNGNVTLNSASTYFVYILTSNTLTPPPAGFSQLDASGTVTLGGATLSGSVGYDPTRSTTFTIIQTTGSGHVSGSFSQGAIAVIGGLPFDVTYNAGNVVLTRDIATSTTTLTDSTAPSDASVYGQPVVFTATVAPETGITGAPQGKVDFYVDGIKVDTETLVTDSNNDGNSSAAYTYNSSTLTPSPHKVKAVYEGDPNAYQTSTSATLNQTVSQATPTVTVAGPTTEPVTGQSFTVTATVTPTAPNTDPNSTLAGTVNFYNNGTLLNITPDNVTSGSDQVSYTFTNGLPAANSTYTITAKFHDTDGNFIDQSGQLIQAVGPDSTTTTIASIPNQSTVDYGTATITAKVTPNGTVSGTPAPGGTVTFMAVSTDGMTTITDANEALNGSDVATMNKLLPVLAAGQSYTVTATYNGDNNYSTSNNSLTQTIAKATTSVTVSSSNASSVYGQPVTFMAKVKPENMGTPTGTAEFIVKDQNGNMVLDDTKNLNSSGVATDTTSATALSVAGSVYSVTVIYSSDNNFRTSTGTLLGGQTVTQASSKVVVTADNNPAVTGQPVTFTATVSPTQFGGTPQGTAEFIVMDQFGNQLLNDTKSLTSGVATDQTSALVASGSAYSVQVIFTDSDGNFSGSSGTLSGGETVRNASTTTTVTPNSATTYGTPVTFTATVAVSTPGSGTITEPSGYVRFFSGTTFLGQNLLNGAGTDQATFTTSATQLPGGADQITAKYVGDANFNTSTSTAITQQVNTAPTATSAVMYTFTPTESPAESSPAVGDTIQFSATVTSSSSTTIGSPTGTVNFYDGSTQIGSGTLVDNGGGVATATGNVNTLTAGSHSITAQYVSDGNFTGSSTPPASALSLSVIQAGTTTTLSPSSSGSEAYGQQLVSVKVTPNTSNAVTPSGQVRFSVKVGGTDFIPPETDTLDNTGAATLQALLPVGTYSITANYLGNSNFNTSSTSSALVETITKANSTTVVTDSATTTPVTGQPINFTVTVSPQFNGVPQGTVNFYLGTISPATQLNTSTITLDGTGKATFTYTPGLTADHAPYNIVAQFTDTDGNFNISDNTAKPFSQSINKDGASTTVASGTPTSNYGASVTFTATVSAAAPGSGIPTGLVDFFSGTTLLGQGTLNGNSLDQASYKTSATQLSGGSDQITAMYEGDTNFTTSPASSPITQTVNAAPTTTGTVSITWANSPTLPVSGQSITLSATVSGGSATLGTPTGTVNFLDNTTVIGSGTLSANGDGTATVTTMVTDLLAGSHSLTAQYVGDGNFATSKGTTAASVTVNQANTTTKVQTTTPNAVYGQTPVTATVTPTAPGSGTPTGTVTFTAMGGGFTYTDTEDLTNGKATMMQLLPVLPAGQSYSITATYNGDSSYIPSPVSSSVTQNYSTATDTIMVSSNANPSINGQAVTFSAVIVPQFVGSLPSGTVVFTIDGSTSVTETVVGNAALYTTSSLGVGTHTVSANYTSSNANFRNNSAVLTGGQVVSGTPPPPPPAPSSNSGGGGGSSQAAAAPAFNFNYEFSLLETDAIYFAYFDQLAALGGFTDPTLDAYVNYFLGQIYSNPLTFSSSGNYAIALGYDIGLYYFALTNPQPTA